MIKLMLHTLKTQMNEYAKNKTWYWYAPLWLLGAYIFMKLLGFKLGEEQSFIVAVPHAFNFMLHEMAHVLTGFFPALITAVAGSFAELLLGSLLVWGAFKGRTYFASLFCFLWLMLSALSVGDYMADARAQQLPLVSLGGELSGSTAVHDWNFIFGELGLLTADTFIGGTVRFVGTLFGLFGLVFAAWLLYKMARAAKTSDLNQKEAELLHKTAAEAGLHSAPPKHFKDLKEGNLYPTPLKGSLSDNKRQDHPKRKNA